MSKKSEAPLPLPPGYKLPPIQLSAFPASAMQVEEADRLRRARKLYGRGLEHSRAARWEEAALKFDEAALTAPGQPEFNYALGCALSQMGRLRISARTASHCRLPIFFRRPSLNGYHSKAPLHADEARQHR